MEMLQPSFGMLFWTILSFLLLAVIVFILVSMWRRKDITQNTKLVWSIFILAAPVIGFLCYFIFGFSKQKVSF